MPQPRQVHVNDFPPPAVYDKLIPSLEAFDPKNLEASDPDGTLRHALLVLGPQVHKGKRYAAVEAATGDPAKRVPTTKDGEYDPAQIRVEVTRVAAEPAQKPAPPKE
jgi:hypothetical protein